MSDLNLVLMVRSLISLSEERADRRQDGGLVFVIIGTKDPSVLLLSVELVS